MPPTRLSSSGQEAVELAALAGLKLDPWQQHVLDMGLSERADGSWSAFEVAVNVPRQNGKGGIIEARELAGLFLLGEKLILHSAHEFKTSIVAFKRIEQLVMGCPDLRKRVLRVRRTTGEEAIELVTGQVLRFLARSGGSGRGFTGDCNVLDEAMILGDDAMGALMPTMSAVPNPQIWYLGSAGIGSPSVQLGRLRARAVAAVEAGEPDPSLAYFEWSVNPHRAECTVGCTDHADADDPRAWAVANPALGIRISSEHVRNEQLSMGSGGIFERERLGVGDYPTDGADTWQVIGEDAWRALAAAESVPEGAVAFAVDATPERSHAAIAAAGTWRGGAPQEPWALAGQEEPEVRRTFRFRGEKVLIVDDDIRNVFALTSVLEQHGLSVLYAENGRVGIEVLEQHDDVTVVLMDIMMPEMDGYATTAAIRRMPQFAGLPIVALTAKAMKGDREKAIESGASDYVTKPVDPDHLLSVMEQWMRGE
ncbi:response regulator [Streptomyces sp. NPDC005989]|uniref:response regulator n=1 Tax=Streptomyces sp. NPDC005989 TaxID=3156727 RepID=UPI0033C953A1